MGGSMLGLGLVRIYYEKFKLCEKPMYGAPTLMSVGFGMNELRREGGICAICQSLTVL